MIPISDLGVGFPSPNHSAASIQGCRIAWPTHS